MKESFTAPEIKENLANIDYDKMVKDLYMAKNRQEFETKWNQIIVANKNKKGFHQESLLASWFDDNDPSIKNELFLNIKSQEEFFSVFTNFKNKFKAISVTPSDLLYGGDCIYCNRENRSAKLKFMDTYLLRYNTIIKRNEGDNTLDSWLNLKGKYNLDDKEASDMEYMVFKFLLEKNRDEGGNSQIDKAIFKKFAEEMKQNPEKINEYIQGGMGYYLHRIASPDIQSKQGIDRGQVIIDNFDKLDVKSLEIVLANRDNSFINFYTPAILEKIESKTSSEKLLSNEHIKVFGDYLSMGVVLNSIFKRDAPEKDRAYELEDKIITKALEKYPTPEKKLSFLFSIGEYSKGGDLFNNLSEEEHKKVMLNKINTAEALTLIRSVEGNNQIKYKDFYLNEIVSKLGDYEKKRLSGDYKNWLGYKYTEQEIALTFKFKTKAEFQIVSKEINSYMGYVGDIISNIDKRLSQEGKQKMLTGLLDVLNWSVEYKINSGIDMHKSDSIRWLYANDPDIVGPWIQQNLQLFVKHYPQTLIEIIKLNDLPKEFIVETYKSLNAIENVNLASSEFFLSLLEFSDKRGLFSGEIDVNVLQNISTLVDKYYSQTKDLTKDLICFKHTDTRIYGILNKLSSTYGFIKKPDMSIIKAYFEKGFFDPTYQVYANRLDFAFSSEEKYQLENLLLQEQGLGQFEDIINKTFPTWLNDKKQDKDYHHILKNFHVILTRDPENQVIQNLFLERLKKGNQGLMTEYDWSDLQGKWSESFLKNLDGMKSGNTEDLKMMLTMYKAFGIKGKIEDILGYTKHNDAQVRALATSALDVQEAIQYYESQNMSIREFVEMLIKLIGDDAGIVRKEALTKLQNLTDEQVKTSGQSKTDILSEAIKKENYRTNTLEQTVYDNHEEDVVENVKSQQYESGGDEELGGNIEIANFPGLPSKREFSNQFMLNNILYEQSNYGSGTGNTEKKETASNKYETFLRQLLKYSGKKMYEFVEMMSAEGTGGLTKLEGAEVLKKVQNLSGVVIVEDEITWKNKYETDAYGTYNPMTNTIAINIQAIEQKAKKENKNVLYVLADVFLHELVHTTDYGVTGNIEKKFDKYMVEYPLASPVPLHEIFTEVFSSMFQLLNSSEKFKKSFEEAKARGMLPELFLKELNDGYGFYTQKPEVIRLILNAPIEEMFAVYIRGDLDGLNKIIEKVFGSDEYLEVVFPKKR